MLDHCFFEKKQKTNEIRTYDSATLFFYYYYQRTTDPINLHN